MKKVEAMELAPVRSNLLIEYIDSFLADSEMVNPRIKVYSVKRDSEPMEMFGIYIPENGFERQFDTDITFQQKDILDRQILDDLIDHYMESDTVRLYPFTTIRGGRFQNFDGIFIQGEDGRIISLHMGYVDKDTVNHYNATLEECAKRTEGLHV